jgi:hypothetical protein
MQHIVSSDVEPKTILQIITTSFQRGGAAYLYLTPFLIIFLPFLYYLENSIASNELYGEKALFFFLDNIFLSLYYAFVAILYSKRSDSYLKIQIGSFVNLFKKTSSIILASIFYYVLVFLGSILLLLPGILFTIWFYLYPTIMVTEKKTVLDAFKRSRYLIKGSFFPMIFLLLIFTGLRFLLETLLLFLPVVPETVNGLVSYTLSSILTLPFEATAIYLLYLAFRADKEAFNFSEYQKTIEQI